MVPFRSARGGACPWPRDPALAGAHSVSLQSVGNEEDRALDEHEYHAADNDDRNDRSD